MKREKRKMPLSPNSASEGFYFSFQISLHSSRNVIARQTLQIFSDWFRRKQRLLPSNMTAVPMLQTLLQQLNKSFLRKVCFCCLINLDLRLSPVAKLPALFPYSALTHHPWHGPSNLCFYPTGRCYQFPNLGFIWSPCLTVRNGPAIFRLVLCSISFQGKCQSL